MRTLILIFLSLVLYCSCGDKKEVCKPGTTKKTIMMREDESVTFCTQEYGTNYGGGVKCSKLFKPKKNARCKINFSCSSFDITTSPNCKKDFLMLNKNKYCNSKSPVDIEGVKKLTVMFKSQPTSAGAAGAECVATCPYVLPDKVECGEKRTKDTIILGENDSIPFFTQSGATYDKKVNCQITFKRKDDAKCKLSFSCSSFDITNSNNCKKDYLKIKDNKYCNSNSPDVPIEGVDQLKVMFKSSKNSKGAEGAECEAKCLSVTPPTTSTTRIMPARTTIAPVAKYGK